MCGFFFFCHIQNVFPMRTVVVMMSQESGMCSEKSNHAFLQNNSVPELFEADLKINIAVIIEHFQYWKKA